MKINIFLINRTYIAEDRATGLRAYAASEQIAIDALTALVAKYWETEKVIIPVKTHSHQTINQEK